MPSRAGSPNKRTQEIAKIVEDSGHCPVAALIAIARESVPCSLCDEGKIDKQKLLVYAGEKDSDVLAKAKKSKAKFTCPECIGTGMKRWDGKVVASANKDLLPFLHPKLSAKTVDKTTKQTRVISMDKVLNKEENAVAVAEMNQAMRDADADKIRKQMAAEQKSRENNK